MSKENFIKNINNCLEAGDVSSTFYTNNSGSSKSFYLNTISVSDINSPSHNLTNCDFSFFLF